MSIFKRLLSLAVASVMTVMVVIPSISASASTLPEDVVGTKYEESVELLNALDIMIGDDNGEFRLEDNITRAEIAKIAVAIAGLTDVAESTKTTANFPDVQSWHWANGYINVSQAQKYVIGDDTGRFRPDDQITYAEVVTILMRVLGYEPAASSNGGYPTGYLVTAGSAGLFKGGISAPTTSLATRGLVAQLAYNALTVNLMERTGFGAYENYEVVDKTLLENKLDVEMLYGQVVATNETTMNGESSLREDQIQIKTDGKVETYKTSYERANEFMARNVVFYVEKISNTEKEIILITADDTKNHEIEIGFDSISSVTKDENFTMNYWQDKENDKKTTQATIKGNATVFYNGVVSEYDLTDITELTSGIVTLVDNDSDEVYDYVFVTELRNMIVDEVSLAGNRITDKYNQLTLTLDPENKDLSFGIYKNGQKISIKDIKEWDVLSVAANAHNISEATVIKVYVSDEKITGKVLEIEDNKYKIGDKFYEVAANYTQSGQPDIKLGDEGTFYLDVAGMISAVDTQTKAGSNYAYLVTADSIGSSINSKVQFQLFTKDGEELIVDGASKVKVNSTSNLKGSAIIDALKEANSGEIAQLVTYDTNSSGELSYINTASTNESSGTALKNTFSLDFTSSEAEFIASSKKLAGFNVTSSTLVFEIPTGAEDIEEYAVRDVNMFVDKSKYDVEIYDLSEDLTAGVIIVKNSTAVVNAESSIAIVTKVVDATNDDGDTIHKLYAYMDGKEVVVNAKDTETLVKEGTKLTTGDIIQFQTNSKGEIDKISILFDSADRANDEIEIKTDVEGTEMTTIIGTVTKKFANSINIKANNMAETNINIADAKVYLYDASLQSKSQVKVVDSSYITKFDEADPEKVFVRIYKGVVTEVVVIKEA